MGLRGPQIHHGPRDSAAAGGNPPVLQEIRDHDCRARDRPRPVAHRGVGGGVASAFSRHGRLRSLSVRRPAHATTKRRSNVTVRRSIARNGLLPWRSTEIYGKLVEAFTQKTTYARENIKFFSSVLTHYASDAHVPFHAVLNHDGQLTGQFGIHSRFESELFERYRSKLRVAPKPISTIGPPRDFVFDTLLASYQLAQPILDADRAAVAGRDLYDDQYFTMFFTTAGRSWSGGCLTRSRARRP